MTFPTRVAAKASELNAARSLLTVLAAPFYLLGLLAGIVIVAVAWCWAAVALGVADVKQRNAR